MGNFAVSNDEIKLLYRTDERFFFVKCSVLVRLLSSQMSKQMRQDWFLLMKNLFISSILLKLVSVVFKKSRGQ